MHVQRFIEEIDLRFQSGNSVPVDRATLKKEEWDVLKAIIESLSRIACGDSELIAGPED